MDEEDGGDEENEDDNGGEEVEEDSEELQQLIVLEREKLFKFYGVEDENVEQQAELMKELEEEELYYFQVPKWVEVTDEEVERREKEKKKMLDMYTIQDN